VLLGEAQAGPQETILRGNMNLIVIGARTDGQAHLLLDAVEEAGEHIVVAFADETPALKGMTVFGRPVVGSLEDIAPCIDSLGARGAAIAIGNGHARFRLANTCREFGLVLPTIIHPTAVVSRYASMGKGVFVGQGVQIVAGAVIGDLALINAGAVVSHHVRVGEAATIGPNATLAGRSSVHAFVLVGAGATLLPDVVVGEGSVVGAGAVVVSEVPARVTVAGVPAKSFAYRP
jgi:sugar O-acyltransferase (sialic acid O-acetyltransferase NeuD family)